jgi:hypothetical protein
LGLAGSARLAPSREEKIALWVKGCEKRKSNAHRYLKGATDENR